MRRRRSAARSRSPDVALVLELEVKRPYPTRASARWAHVAPMAHSITSSARARRVGEIVSSSARAVLRLMKSSTLVACWTGRSAGLAPARILPVT